MKKKENTDPFLVSFHLERGLLGETTFQLNMSISIANKTIDGSGTISQAINPPVKVVTRFCGTYDYLTVMGHKSILLKVTGYPMIDLPNLELTMAIDSTWQSGIASYRYRKGIFDGVDDWIDVSDVPVKAISLNVLEPA